jgi:hypothetical protein
MSTYFQKKFAKNEKARRTKVWANFKKAFTNR